MAVQFLDLPAGDLEPAPAPREEPDEGTAAGEGSHGGTAHARRSPRDHYKL